MLKPNFEKADGLAQRAEAGCYYKKKTLLVDFLG